MISYEEDEVCYGESVAEWREETIRLRSLLELWDVYRLPTSTDEQFEELILTDDGIVEFQWERMVSLLNHRTWDCDDPYERDFICRTVEFQEVPQHITGEAPIRRAARLLMQGCMSSQLQNSTVPVIEIGKGGQLSLQPKHLLACLYIHVMQELLGRADPLVRCACCGKWFICRHASKMYCSDACKMKAYRQNKKGEAK